MELEKAQQLSQGAMVELTFTVNDQPFRMWGQVSVLRNGKTIGIHFPSLSDRVRKRLACLIEELIEDFIAGTPQRGVREQRRGPRVHCTGTVSVRPAVRQDFLFANLADLSTGGCQIAFKEPHRLWRESFVDLKFEVNHLPFRVSGQVKGIRSATTAGFGFPLLSESAQTQLEDLVEELIRNLIKQHFVQSSR